MESIGQTIKTTERLSPSPTDKPVGYAQQSAKYECETCKDETGYIVTGDDGNPAWRVCHCVEQRKIKRLMRSSQMSDQLRQLGFRNFKSEGRPQAVKDAEACALDYLEKFDSIRQTRQNSIALLGVPGCGKTHLLVAIANNLLAKKSIGVLYFPHVEGFGDIRDNLDEMEEKLGVMKSADVLLWDDLFKGRKEPTPFQLDCIFNVINYRYLNNKPIMVSSERDIDAICAVDMGIGSRIYEMTKEHTVILTTSEGAGIKDLNFRLKGV